MSTFFHQSSRVRRRRGFRAMPLAAVLLIVSGGACSTGMLAEEETAFAASWSNDPVDGGKAPSDPKTDPRAENDKTDKQKTDNGKDGKDKDWGKDETDKERDAAAEDKESYGCPVVLTYSKDLQFIDFMVPHHLTGIELAAHVIERGRRDDVKAFAMKDKEAQLRQMNLMLQKRKELTGNAELPAPPDDPKMKQEIERFRSLSGDELDELFLKEIIPHHASSIEVSHRSKATLRDRAIRKVAREIFEGQSREIAEVEVLRGKFRCDVVDKTDDKENRGQKEEVDDKDEAERANRKDNE